MAILGVFGCVFNHILIVDNSVDDTPERGAKILGAVLDLAQDFLFILLALYAIHYAVYEFLFVVQHFVYKIKTLPTLNRLEQ
jgi:hypothetical protein